MKTPKFNLNNWTGHMASVTYTKDGEFSMSGYRFKVGPFVEVFHGAGYRKLSSSDWKELTTLHLDSDSLEEAIIAAARYVANYI